MSEDDRRDAEPSDEELGPPILELADFALEPRGGFVDRVRRRIDRRTAGSHLLVFLTQATLSVLREFLELIFTFTSGSKPKGDSP